MWKQKYSPVAGLISTKNKGTCKAQPQTRYMVCLNCERGSQLSKSSGPKTIPVDGSNTFYALEAKCIVQRVMESESGDLSSSPSFIVNYLQDLKQGTQCLRH